MATEPNKKLQTRMRGISLSLSFSIIFSSYGASHLLMENVFVPYVLESDFWEDKRRKCFHPSWWKSWKMLTGDSGELCSPWEPFSFSIEMLCADVPKKDMLLKVGFPRPFFFLLRILFFCRNWTNLLFLWFQISISIVWRRWNMFLGEICFYHLYKTTKVVFYLLFLNILWKNCRKCFHIRNHVILCGKIVCTNML